jgi:hypothetical protein
MGGRSERTKTMPVIERNYRKNPHTASFLQVFHTGISSTGRNSGSRVTPGRMATTCDRTREPPTGIRSGVSPHPGGRPPAP